MADRPLILTDNLALLDDLLRVAAAAEVEVDHHLDPDVRGKWRTAPVVLIDAAMVGRAVDLALPRRARVVVVATAEPESAVWELCVRLGAERTMVLPRSEEELISVLADASGAAGGTGVCIAVLGACGGAGASVFAAGLALAAAAEQSTALLVDCDPWGPGQDVVLGIETDPGLRWSELAVSAGRLAAGELHRALPGVRVGSGRVAVLCRGRTGDGEIGAAAVDVVLDSGRRGGGTTVVDLPRHPGVAADRVLEQADLAVVVAPADVRGCWAADRICGRLRQFGVRTGMVVRGPSPGGLGAGDLAEILQMPVLARMRADPLLARDLEFGLGLSDNRRRPLARAARQVLLSMRGSS